MAEPEETIGYDDESDTESDDEEKLEEELIFMDMNIVDLC